MAAWLRAAVSGVVGLSAGAVWRPYSTTIVHAEATSTATDSAAAADDLPPVDPVKCVVVGGGYAGSRIAYQLDSVFHVTLIDTKNYFEASDELTSVFTAPDDEAFEERLKHSHALHRFYLRRARVITNKVVEADGKHVVLSDGRVVPYDLLILATGEERPYPWRAEATTYDVREAQLREFRHFLSHEKRKKIAVIGGGPKGVSLANCLAMRYLDKEVHLFHSTSSFAPKMPYETRERMDAMLTSNTHVHLHKNSVVTNVKMTIQDNDTATPTEVAPVAKKSWWSFGKSKPEVPRGPQLTTDSTVKYALDVSLREDTKLQVPSVLYQAWSGLKPTHNLHRGKEIGTDHFEGFDYVFNCTGHNGSARQFSESLFLGPHVDSDGHFIASRYMQLLGNPRVFALGRCNNFAWMRSMGNSDFQARTLFRNLLSVANMNEVRTGNLIPTMSPLTNSSMAFPRIIVPMDEFQAAGSIAWSGSTLGTVAFKELMQDRKYYLKEFTNPIFFKQQDDKKVRDSFDTFFKQNVTDVSDFDLSEA